MCIRDRVEKESAKRDRAGIKEQSRGKWQLWQTAGKTTGGFSRTDTGMQTE